MRRASVLVVVAALLAGPRRAAAYDAGPEWYGWQIGATDALAATSWLVTAKTGFAPLFALGAIAYVGGGPAAHLQHDQGTSARWSLGARLGSPLVGLAAAYIVAAHVCARPPAGGLVTSDCQRTYGLTALVAPMVVTSVVDIALAWKRPRALDSAARRRGDFALAWAPVVAPAGAGATFGLAGRF